MALGAFTLVVASAVSLAAAELPDNREFMVIVNNDIDNILAAASGADTTPSQYEKAVLRLLDVKPGILAQNVGMPNPVIYRSKIATTWEKYYDQAVAAEFGEAAARKDTQAACMKALLDAGTDPLTLTIEACRERGVAIVTSYRMNAEDFGAQTTNMSDFGKAHRELRIPGRNCLDPAHPEVFRHRMEIFTEVAADYDIDGIEFDFKRWTHMVSDPHDNHTVLTRMVAQTRKMLDEVAQRKGRKHLLLGVRVGPSLATPPSKAAFPGIEHLEANPSCLDQGTDVKTWIEKGYVDYVCPSLFWPRLPGLPSTREFVKLAEGTDVGIYPTIFGLPAWAEVPDNAVPDSEQTRSRHCREVCEAALRMYEDGADGISTFNMFPQYYPVPGEEQPGWGGKREWSNLYGRSAKGYGRTLQEVMPLLGSRDALQEYLSRQAPSRGQ